MTQASGSGQGPGGRASGRPGGSLAEFEVRRIDVDGAQIAVRIAGEGPPLVLLHGFPQHSLMWHAIAPALADRFTVIVPDQRGLGASTISVGGYSKTELARDLAAVLDALGHDRVRLAGYDLGAGVAAAFAREYPERVERLAVMEFVLPGFGLEAAMAPRPGWHAGSNWHFAVFAAPDVATWLFTGRERALLEWFFWHGSHGGSQAVSDDHLLAYERALSRPGVLRAGAEYYASIWRDAEDNAPLKETPLAMPVLAIGGEANMGPILERLWGPVASTLTTQVITGAGHWLGDEQPLQTAQALRRFFEEPDSQTEKGTEP